MKIRFTEKGAMEILMENDLEKEIFPCIERDAKSLGEEWVSDSLGPDFDDPWFGYWQEWVQPEVQEKFDAQLASLRKFSKSKSGDNDVLFVPGAYIESWYGAVNQARLSLENIFNFTEESLPESKEESVSIVEQWPEEKQGAYQRAHFYAWFQRILLEGMMRLSSGESFSGESRTQTDEGGD